ncbi:MAG: pseudouridine synthase [Bacteroidetes bacterium]|nr:pseudouridine synthase [Bacteroidota bacterium]MDA1119173.1 pseudouridine synthase [Bacteroidota bacterium]
MPNLKLEDIIVLETDGLLIVNKPPHISTLEDRINKHNLLKSARQYCPQAQVCHRLDKETSGIVVLAKNNIMYKHMSSLFEKRKIEKLYHAVSVGIHNFQNIEVDAPIKTLTHGVVKIDNVGGKKSTTYFKTLKAYRNASLIECRPITGRTHQIRIHLAILEAPIIEDLQYGGTHFYLSSIKPKFNLKKDSEELPLIKRVALHARSLKFKDLDGKEIFIEAPYPKDFGVLIKQLEKYV